MEHQGPTMMVMTKLLRPGASRVGSLGEHIVLPRSVKTTSIVGVAVGFSVGVIIGAPLAPLIGQGAFFVIGMFTALGWAATSWSPLKGESFSTWIYLKFFSSRQNRIQVPEEFLGEAAGKKNVQAYIGLCPAPNSVVLGPVTYARSAVEIDPTWIENKGLPVTVEESKLFRNIPL